MARQNISLNFSSTTDLVAAGVGALAGLVTLLLFFSLLGLNQNKTESNPATQLAAGDCFEMQADSKTLTMTDCQQPHLGEAFTAITYPEDTTFSEMEKKAPTTICKQEATNYLGADLFETDLKTSAFIPTQEQWDKGTRSVVCYITKIDESPLDKSVKSSADQFPRSSQALVSRLLPGDCYNPTTGTNPYDLNTRTPVELTSCHEPHHGHFFGSALLEPPSDTTTPSEEDLLNATTAKCSAKFQEHFASPASGFNFRFWRPSVQSWSTGDRSVLCTILDKNPLQELFDPTQYLTLVDLEPATCFTLGPEESKISLGITDRVLPTDCDQPHNGQMISAGSLSDDPAEPYPGGEEAQQLVRNECETLFTKFIGRPPHESEFVKFPYWFPEQSGWENGDRRFVCAFVADEAAALYTESLEGIDR